MSKVVIVDVKDLRRPCRLRLTDPITPKGVIGGDICASSNGKTLIHRQNEKVHPWEPRRLKLKPKIRYGSGTEVEPTPKETRSIRGCTSVTNQ